MSSNHEYYPQINRLRRWHVKFGNPALGTYGGSIITVHSRKIERSAARGADDLYEPDEDETSTDSFSSCSSLDTLKRNDKIYHHGQQEHQRQRQLSSVALAANKPSSRTAVMTNVPPHQVPDGVLNLVRSHRPFIEHVRIVIGASRSQEREFRWARRLKRSQQQKQQREQQQHTLRQRSQTWACENENEEASPAATVALVGSFARLPTEDNNELPSPHMTKDSRSISLDITCAMKEARLLVDYDDEKHSAEAGASEEKEERIDEMEDEHKNYHLLFVFDSDLSAQTFVADLHHRPYTTLDESETCSVYPVIHVGGENGVNLLGPFFASSTSNDDLTTSESNITQHSLDDHQCPVCLEKMALPSTTSVSASTSASIASSSILTTVCNHSFHIDCLARWQDSPCPVCRYDHSGLNETLSRCHVCSTTVRNYVCLICGVVSCANGPPSSVSRPMATASSEQTPSFDQIPSQRGHALLHYEETLHAYALDTETQHVWDFAGGGYVHRLLQSEDGKIVESADPRLVDAVRERELLAESTGEVSSMLTAMERSTIPTYSSSADDDEAVHRKLEGFASQYYTLLKSQLEQQRIYYEGRLEAIRREYDVSAPGSESQSTSDLIAALKQERNQLEQRCATLRRKHKKVHDDVVFLKNMNESLEADRHVFRQQISQARAELAEARAMTQQQLAPLEEKVHLLMLQLTADDDSSMDKKPAAKAK
ncbi:hypothetical protein ACHAWX_003173 [Stephanocyclus meneghinianus]